MAVVDIVIESQYPGKREIRTARSDVEHLDKTADRATRGGLSRLHDALGRGLQRVAQIGVAALAGIATAIGTVSFKGLQSFGRLQKGMNEVFTLLPNISEQAMSEMTNQVQEFNQRFGVLSEKSVPALYQALSAGVPQDNVFEFLETAQKAALGGVTELETAVDGISSVVNSYGSEVISATEASDKMFTAVRLGKTNFEELSRFMFQVTPVASALGVNFGEVTASLAALTSQGVPTRVASTQLRQALVELSKQGGETAETFQELSGQTFREFVQSGGTTQQALQLLEQHAQATGVGINDLFSSVEAGNAALGLTGKGTEAFSNALAEMGSSAGATDAAFERMDRGIIRSVERIRAAFATIVENVGQQVEPVFAQFADFVQSIMPVVSDSVENAIGKFVNFTTATIPLFLSALRFLQREIEPVFNGIVATIDRTIRWVRENWIAVANVFRSVAEGIDRVRKEVLQPIVESIIGTFEGLVDWVDEHLPNITSITSNVVDDASELWARFGEAISGVAAAFLAAALVPKIAAIGRALMGINPTIAAVSAAIGGLVLAWTFDLFNIRDHTQAAVNAITEVFKSFQGETTNTWSTLGELLGTIAESTWQYVSGLIEGALGIISGSIVAMSGLIIGDQQMLRDGLTTIWESIRLVLTTTTQSVVDVVGAAFRSLGIDFSEVGQTVMDTLGRVLSALETFGPAALREIALFVTGNETEFTALKSLIGEVVLAYGNLFNSIINFVQENFLPYVKALGQWAVATWQWIATAAPIAWQHTSDYVSRIVGIVAESLPKWTNALGSWFTASWQWIATAVTRAGAETLRYTSRILRHVAENLPNWLDNLEQWTIAAWQWIGNAIPNMVAGFTGWVNALFDSENIEREQWAIRMAIWGRLSWQWLSDILGTLGARIGEWGSTLFDYVSNNLPTWISNLGQWAFEAWRWLRDVAVPNTTTWISNWGGALFGYLGDNLSIWGGHMGDWAGTAWEWLRDVAVPNTIAWIGNWGSALIGFVADNLPAWVSTLGDWLAASWQWLRDVAVPNTITWIGNWGSALIGFVADNLPTWIETLLKWATAAVDWIGDAAVKGLEALSAYLFGLVNFGESTRKEEFDPMVKAWAKTFWTWIYDDLIPAVGPALLDFVIEVGDVVGDIAVEFGKFGVALALAMIAGIVNSIGEGMHQLFNIAGQGFMLLEHKIGMWLSNVVSNWVTAGRNWIGGLIQGVGEVARALYTKIRSIISNAIEAAKQALGIRSPSSVFAQFGQDIIDGLAGGISAHGSRAVDAIDSVASSVAGRASDAMESVTTLADAVGGIASGVTGSAQGNTIFGGITDPEVIARRKEIMEAVTMQLRKALSNFGTQTLGGLNLGSQLRDLGSRLWGDLNFHKSEPGALKHFDRETRDQLRSFASMLGISTFANDRGVIEGTRKFLQDISRLSNVDLETDMDKVNKVLQRLVDLRGVAQQRGAEFESVTPIDDIFTQAGIRRFIQNRFDVTIQDSGQPSDSILDDIAWLEALAGASP